MRKFLLVILSFFVLSVPSYAANFGPYYIPDDVLDDVMKTGKYGDKFSSYYAYPSSSDDGVRFYFSKDYINYVYDFDDNSVSLGDSDGYIYYYKYRNSAFEFIGYYRNQLGNIEFPSGYDIYLFGEHIGYENLTSLGAKSVNYMGELLPHLRGATEISKTVGKAAGLIISFAALPILMIILAVLLIPRLVRYFRH